MAKREGNRPERRIAPAGSISPDELQQLIQRVRYTGSGLHKLGPGDYGFTPSHNPRPSKSACDELRPILFEEASELLRRGIEFGMVSAFAEGGVPKYIWAVDGDGEVYEAKTEPGRETGYHGYRLGDDDADMRRYVLKEWKRRCRAN